MNRCFIALCLLFSYSHKSIAANEDWYFMAALGSADIDNKTSASEDTDYPSSLNYMSDLAFSMDIAGIYFPVEESGLLWGGAIHSDTQLNNSIGALNGLYGISTMYFPSQKHGSGIFFRGDAGIARNIIIRDSGNDLNEKTGVGALLGLGYGIPVSSESRVLFSINHSNSRVRDGNFSSTSIMIGGLW